MTKIYFPKEIFPIAAMLASLFDFFVASGALADLPIDGPHWLESLSGLGSRCCF